MNCSQRPADISHASLINEASSYSSLITKDIHQLEEICREEIPRTLLERKAKGPAFLTKSETQKLLEWKLKHGKYRPNLPKLLASNSEKDVESITRHAFEIYTGDSSDFKKALEILVKLKGVGPATASLILSRFDRETVPFFSDELFRWMHFDDGIANGWDRKISYSSKEYLSLYNKVSDLRKKLNKGSAQTISAEEVEKAAYAIFKKRASDTPQVQDEVPIKDMRDGALRKRGRELEEDVPASVISNVDTKKPRRKRRKP